MASMNTPGGNKVPGFDFLQGLMKSAGSAMPGMNAWIAPTLDPEELNKRIEELRTVQFWLEQNAKLIGTSIQALEVQRMTLSTLKNLNVQVSDLGAAMKVKVPPADAEKTPSPGAGPAAKSGQSAPPPTGVVDPTQWWSALTQQFSELAVQAIKDSGVDKMAEAAADLPAQALKAAKKATRQARPAAKAPAKTSSRRKS